MSTEKRYAAVKKVSLAGLSEEWGDECYAYVVPATYADQKELLEREVDEDDKAAQIAYQTDFVKEHFISGKIKVFTGGEFELTDMSEEDTNASVAINDHLYVAIMGFELDPKDIRKVVAQDSLQSENSSTTEMPSSGS